LVAEAAVVVGGTAGEDGLGGGEAGVEDVLSSTIARGARRGYSCRAGDCHALGGGEPSCGSQENGCETHFGYIGGNVDYYLNKLAGMRVEYVNDR